MVSLSAAAAVAWIHSCQERRSPKIPNHSETAIIANTPFHTLTQNRTSFLVSLVMCLMSADADGRIVAGNMDIRDGC